MEESLEDELQRRLNAPRYARTAQRRGWRNGSYWWQVSTRWGIVDIRMPRARQRQPESSVLGRFWRRELEVDELLRVAFLRGISTREVGEVWEPVLGYRPSAQTISRVTQTLQKEVQRFHWRSLPDDLRYLLLDVITRTVKHPGGVRKKLVLVAYGVRLYGTRVLPDFRVTTAESAVQWESFLAELQGRGLEGTHLALIVTDGVPGLIQAVEMTYPRIPRQRCWVHKLRNVAAKLPRKHQASCLKGAKAIYLAETALEAGKRFQTWAKEWRAVVPGAVRCLEQDMEELLSFYQCRPQDWRMVRTTNAIERAFREVRRRTRPMSCFQNNASCERIIFAIFTHLNTCWSKTLLSPFTQ